MTNASGTGATYRVEGMTCQGCARALTRAIEAEAPGAQVTVDLAAALVQVAGADQGAVERAATKAQFRFGGVA